MRFDSNVVPKLSWTKKSDGFCAEEVVLCKMKAGPNKIRCFLFEEETSGNKWCSENEFMKKKGRELMVMGREVACAVIDLSFGMFCLGILKVGILKHLKNSQRASHF